MIELGLPVILLILWTSLIRWFPAILGKAFEKHIEYRYDRNLENIKAELQASYSNLKASVDFLSATQSELRSKVISATEALWSSVCVAEKEFRDLMFIDSVMVPEEVDKAISGEIDVPILQQLFEAYKKPEDALNKLSLTEEVLKGTERLFVGDHLWLVYSTIIAVHGRFGFLLSRSLRQGQYLNWRDDKHMSSLFVSCLSENLISSARNRTFGGLRIAIAHLQSEFIKEATRVMSGSQGFSDDLSNIHSIVQYEKQQIQQMMTQRDSSPGN